MEKEWVDEWMNECLRDDHITSNKKLEREWLNEWVGEWLNEWTKNWVMTTMPAIKSLKGGSEYMSLWVNPINHCNHLRVGQASDEVRGRKQGERVI